MLNLSFLRFSLLLAAGFISNFSFSQLKWENADALFQPLPPSVHVYKSTSPIDGKPNIAYYVEADLKDKKLDFTVDTSQGRRLRPSSFFEKNNNPLLVVNCIFFSFQTNKSLNLVIKDNDIVASSPDKFRKNSLDSNQKIPVYSSAFGVKKNRKADIAWVQVDSVKMKTYATQIVPSKGKYFEIRTNRETGETTKKDLPAIFRIWKMKTAVGGGPVLIQNGNIQITNNEELKFTGNAINDKHPRTAMGYTKDRKLIVLVIEGRNKGIAEGASLTQEAQILKDIGCWEALNLDGGGSSCMLVNGKETITPSDKEGQRTVPAVFIIKAKK